MDCRAMIIEPLSVPTRRELQALRLLSEGLNGVQAAKRMGISYQTLKNHLAHVYLKLGARRSVHAVVIALRKGLI